MLGRLSLIVCVSSQKMRMASVDDGKKILCGFLRGNKLEEVQSFVADVLFGAIPTLTSAPLGLLHTDTVEE